MHLIAKQPYVKVEREVGHLEQCKTVQKRFIYLYHEKVVTKHRTFPIQHVFDMSYKKIAEAGGLLYFHTISGVYSYTVTSSPAKFIEAFKRLKK
ncbi:hypothetical protein [Virgibacillus alimentarius]|uniref:HTH LytTR-type domain-containing protein n=1 Tax=Virgibacillus alimentarius TaxID=698769 RepID=A0ABS4S7S0_9BACI|nr:MULTISPECIES: hypothetical protein [Virgibacillus]MBP2257515.1 hypothetical protein [Virgibacillus alimentarius]HLR67625.1 hypothetical protein [Virgibacillus sp.]